MPDTELGFTDRLAEQLFKVGPGSRCFAAAAEGSDWLKMEIAELSMQAAAFLSTRQLHLSPKTH